MGCEQYKSTDYSAEAIACREKELSSEKKLDKLKKDIKTQQSAADFTSQTLKRNPLTGEVIQDEFSSFKIKEINKNIKGGNKDVLEANALVDSLKPVTVDEWNSETERLKNLNGGNNISASSFEAILNRAGKPSQAQFDFVEGREEFFNSNDSLVSDLYKMQAGPMINGPRAVDNKKDQKLAKTANGRNYLKISEDMSFYSKAKRNRIKNNQDLTQAEKDAQLQAIDQEFIDALPEGVSTEFKNNQVILSELFTNDNKDSWSGFKMKNPDGTIDEDYQETILPTNDLKAAVIDLLSDDKAARRKLGNDTFDIQSKENLITAAKTVVLKNQYDKKAAEFAKANELLYKYKDLKNVPDSVIKQFNSIRKKAADETSKVSIELAFNEEDKVFKNNFKMTDDFKAWRDKHVDGSVSGDIKDFVGTLGQGLLSLAAKVTGGTSVWVSRIGVDTLGALGFDDDGRMDAKQDYLEDIFTAYAEKNYLGVSDKDSSITEGFKEDMTVGQKLLKAKSNINFRTGTKTIANLLPFTLGVVNSTRKGDLKGLKNHYSLLKGMGASKNLVNNIRMGAFAYKATIMDNYMEAKDLGLNREQSQAYANGMSLVTASVQAIMPDINMFNTAGGNAIKKGFVDNLKRAATSQGRKQVVKQLWNNSLGEILEEEAELFGSDLIKHTVGLSNEMQFFNLNTQVETVFGTLMLTGATSAATASSTAANTRKNIYNQYRSDSAGMLQALKDSKSMAVTQLQTAKQNGNKKAIARAELQLEQINQSATYGMDLIKAINVAPDIMNDNQLELLTKKEALIRQKLNLRSNSTLKTGIDAEIAAIDAQIEGSAITENKKVIKERTDANVKKLAAENNIGFTQAKDSAEALSLIKENNKRIKEENRNRDRNDQIPLINESDANGNGFIIQNADGSQDIIINEDVAGDNEAITTAQHEFFHGALFKTLQNNPGAIDNMAQGLRDQIDKMEATGVSFNNSFIQQKLDAYKNDPKSIKSEELLTIFSEGMTEGYIKFEEGNMTKFGDVVRRALSSMGVKAKFNNGKDVYNFIKDFNKGVEKGKFSKGMKSTIKEGAEVNIKTDEKVDLTKESVFKPNPSNEQKIELMYSGEGRMQQKALNIAKEYIPKIQGLINSTDNNVFGTDQKFNDIRDLAMSPDVPNSVYNTVMNYNPDSGISLDETIGRALNPESITKVSSKASKSGDIKSELDTFVQSQDGNTKYSSKKDFQTSEDFGLAFDKIENSNLLDGLIRQGVSEAYLDMNPDFVQNAKQRIGDKFAKEFDPTKNESLFGWLTGKNKSGQSIINLAKGDIQNKNKKNIDTTSIDASTRQIADTSTETNQEVDSTKKLNPDSVLPSGDNTTEFLTDTKKELSKLSTAELSDIRYSTSQSVAQKAFAKVFGIPASRIFNKKDNLRKGEAKEIQRFILKNASKLMKLLPEGNAPVRVVTSKTGDKKIKRGGESVALPRKLQNLFYNQSKTADGKPIKVDSESGKQSLQYKKNTTINQTQFLEAFGIKDGKIDPDFVPRSGEAQAIKGLMEIVARNVTNLAARQELDTRKDIAESKKIELINKIGEGKSRVMRSENVKFDPLTTADIQYLKNQDREQLLDFQTATDIDLGSIEKQYGIFRESTEYVSESDGKTKKESRVRDTKEFKDMRKAWINGLAGEIDISFITQPGMISKGKRGLFPNKADVFKDLGIKVIKNKNGNPDYKKMTAKAVELGIFKKEGLKAPSKIDYSTGVLSDPKKFKAYTKTQAFKDNEALKLPYLKSIAELMEKNMIENPSSIGMWAAFMRESDSNSSSLVRRSAPIRFLSKIAGKLVEEHSMPVNNAAKYLFYSALQGKTDYNFGFIEQHYFQGALRDTDDKKMKYSKAQGKKDLKAGNKLKAGFFNYIAKMPSAFFTMKNITTWARYNNKNVNSINGGIDFNTYEMIDTGLTVSEEMKKYKELAQNATDIAASNIKADNVITKGQEVVSKQSKSVKITPEQLNADVNNIIQDTKGIDARKRFSDIVAKRRGAKVINFKLISSGAQDFQGLMYDLYGKGKKGEQQQKWVQDNLVKPYQKGIADIDKYRQALKNDYATLLKKFPNVSKKLSKTIPGTEFTYDQAIRVGLWTQAGYEIPGLSKRDIKKLNSVVNKDPEINLFNEAALLISKQDKWVEPSAYWDSESLISDLNSLTNKVGRKQFLAEFIQNADVIFSKENLNKMEVALGTNWREAMEDSLYRMKNGTNRPSGTNKLTNQFNNWVNNSIGAIMFFNRKSALLQTISSVNFLNWSDNNPFKAALAFGNQPQYWSDFATLWNSPKLKQRRSGLRKDVNEAELANAAKGALNKPQAILSYLLKIGFTPTQLADSFAIASGGATFYRNRLNTYKKQGMSETEAADKAFEDFSATSDVSQQSADPMLISQQQASTLGRLLLAFQNTPAQVTRIFNKSARDFINGRGDQKTNVSKMLYYGAVQGMIFATLQNALFAAIPGFDDEDDEEKRKQTLDKKEERILNSMVDTMLRGSGIYGAIVATMKNTIMTYFKEEKKDAFGKDHRNTLLEALNLSPPVGSKLRKINNAIKAKDYNEEVIKEQGWDITLKGKVNLSPSYQVVASLAEAITNLPLERAVVEIDAIVETLDARNTTFQRIALALGYRTWDVGTKNEERDLVKIESKQAKEAARKQKVIDDRAERKRLKELEKYKGKTKEEIKQMKRRDSIVDTNKSDQVKSLINLGLTKKQIKELKYEDDRVNKIIELTNK